MRTKVTLVLLFLNVIVAFYIFRYENAWRAENTDRELRRRVLPPQVASMTAFTRRTPDGASLRIEKRPDGWYLTEPYEWPANTNAVARILNELQFLENFTKFKVADLGKTGLALADYGLDSPALVVGFTAAGQDYQLKIGDDTRTSNRLYLLSPDGENVHVVNRSLADTLNLPLADIRAASIFTVPVFEVRSLGVQTGALKIRLRRDGSRWTFETPIQDDAGKAAVEVTINSLNSIRTGRFYDARDPAIERAGLDTPRLRVTLEGNARRETLLVGQPAPRPEGVTPETPTTYYFARFEDKPVVFSAGLPDALVTVLQGAQEELRDRHVIDFEMAAVSTITLAAPGQASLNLQRLESPTSAAAEPTENWQLVASGAGNQGPLTQPADPEVVRKLLEQLHHLLVTKFVSDAPSAADLETYGFNRAEREITLAFTGPISPTQPGSARVTIGTAPEQRDVAYAKLGNAPYIYQISPEIIRSTPLNPLHYRQRTLRDLPTGARITGLRLTETGAADPLVARNLPTPDTSWESVFAEEPPARRPALEALRTELRRLRAKSFVAAAFNADGVEIDGVLTPWKFRLDVTLSLVGGNGAEQTSTLFLSPRLGGAAQLGGTPEFGGVTFELTQELIDALFVLTYAEKNDPGPAAPPPIAEKPKT